MDTPNSSSATATYAGGVTRERWATASSEATALGALKRFYKGCASAKVGTRTEERSAMDARFRQVTGKTGGIWRRLYREIERDLVPLTRSAGGPLEGLRLV